MANDTSSRTWSIDTPAATPVYQPQVYIKFIEVVGGAVAGAQGASMATITDRNGKPIIKPQFQTVLAGEIQTYNLENWFEGLIVSALGAGPVTLLVHVK
jgi:hypothetical protein